MVGLTEAIASFVVNTPSAEIPEEAIGKAKKVVTDSIGVILAGTSSDVAPALLRYVAQAGGHGSASILATGIKTSPELAALANGTLGHSLDYDDVHRLIPGHPSVVVLSALLATLDERKVSGRGLLDAYIFGVEVAAKIGVAIGSQVHYDHGWHSTSTISIFGAVAALARLHHLDVSTTRQAIGIAASMASGIQRNFGTMTKSFHSGWAARNALVAFQLASDGFTAAPDALETKAGFLAVYGNEESNAERAVEQLGRPYAVIDPGAALKRFPCCSALLRSLDGMLELRAEHRLTAENTESVQSTVPPGGLLPLIYPKPDNGLQGKFSMPYALAASLLDGKIGFGTFTDEAVKRPEILELLPRMKAVEDPRVCPGDPQGKTLSPGTRGFVELQVITRKGETLTKTVQYYAGSPKKEMTWDEVRAKFLDCAEYGRVNRDRAEEAAEALSSLERSTSVKSLVELLQ